jgi:hypothetical protein
VIRTAAEIFATFVDIVVKEGVFSDEERARPTRGGAPIELSEDRRREIARDKEIDTRVPYLMRVSGKGGRAPHGADRARYERFRNVTLLDHLTSVVRGALVIAEIDLRAAGIDEDALRRRLARIAAIAFLHDGDKMLGRARSEKLMPDDFVSLAGRYRVDRFLGEFHVRMDGADLLQFVSNVEITRHDLLVPGARLPSADDVGDCAYIRLADRLDGVFLDERKGTTGIIAELKDFTALRTGALRRDWRALTIRAPQTPFLLDELQGAFSEAVFKQTGMPPLIEVHLDGELTLVAPETVFDHAFAAALADVRGAFASGIRVMTNTRGARDLLDGCGGVKDLCDFFEGKPRECSKALFVHRSLIEGGTDGTGSIRKAIESHFDPVGLGPHWGGLEKFAGQHFQPWPIDDRTDGSVRRQLVDAAIVAVSLACPPPTDKVLAARTPDDAAREAELLDLLAAHGAQPPQWLGNLPSRPHKLSRHTLLGLHAAGAAAHDPHLAKSLLGARGLVETWLRGNGGRAGILEKNDAPDVVLGEAARDWLRAQAGGAFFRGELDTESEDRCHFTNLPVGPGGRIDTKTGLYGINVSAFSGREGRPESHTSTASQTLVSRAARAEHRLRAIRNDGVTSGDVPVFVSSPTSGGLFWSLRLTRLSGGSRTELSLYDVVRARKEAGKKLLVESDTAEIGTRTMIGRFTALPTRLGATGNTPGLIGFAAIAVDAARRAGRPIHVFRGLPRRSNAFVEFDCLPRPVERALEAEFGSAALRLEDLPDASRLLRLVEDMIQHRSLGSDIALGFADPTTRLGAGCLALATLDRTDDKNSRPLRFQITTLTRRAFMEQTDDPIIAFAKAMTHVQAAPHRDASNAEKDLGMSAAIEAVEGARGIAHPSPASLVAAIVGKLENELSRGRIGWPGRVHGRHFPVDHACAAAEVFVDRVWKEAFRNRAPASRARRSAFAIYRFAFLEASHAKFPTGPADADPVETI